MQHGWVQRLLASPLTSICLHRVVCRLPRALDLEKVLVGVRLSLERVA
jgi:hypothetical protein